jgi:3-oxoacyl-[acyl-carrier-protein] synthase II
MLYSFGDFALKDQYAPVWARRNHPGFAIGSAGAFLVMESREHAEARGAKPYAKLTKVVADLAKRKQPGAVTQSLRAMWPQLGVSNDNAMLITGATGAEPATSEERAFLGQHPGLAVRATGTTFGHTMEAQFPLGLALAALSISRGAPCLVCPTGDAASVFVGTPKPYRVIPSGASTRSASSVS